MSSTQTPAAGSPAGEQPGRAASMYRELVKHTGIFALGAILFRVASIVLLPVYTHYLRPEDYGIFAILDLAVNVISIVAGGGIATAATRAFFSDNVRREAVWWTAVTIQMAIVTALIVPALVLRHSAAAAMFGPAITSGPHYVAIALCTLWIGCFVVMMETYFRALKASTFVVTVGLIRLLANVAVNVILLVGFHTGLVGVLWGNLISAAVASLIQATRFVATQGGFHFDRRLALTYLSFGWPLVVAGLCSTVMHEADRYVLRVFVSLRDVGLYSVAYQIGQGVNTLVIAPFASIWSVLMYEVARQPDSRATFTRVFRHFVSGLALVLFLASLFAGPILHVIAAPDYAPAADLVPIVCLAYLFFSLHDQFRVPVLLTNRTVELLPAVILAAALNLALNFALVPRFAGVGAAWASVATFACYSFVGLVRYRRIEAYRYEFGRCALVVGGMAVTYAVYRAIVPSLEMPAQIALGGAIWLAWVGALFGGLLRQIVSERTSWYSAVSTT